MLLTQFTRAFVLMIGSVMANLGRQQLSTFTTNCTNFIEATSCVWLPNDTVIPTPISNGPEYHLNDAKVDFVDSLPYNYSSVALNNLGIRWLNKDLRFDVYGNTVQAHRIELINNSISSLDTLFPTNTTYLDVRGNEITTIGNLTSNENIDTMVLYSNQIATIDKSHFPPKLTHLYLGFNNLLESIDRAQFPTTLLTLDVKGNRISSIPPSILPSSLVDLDLSYNKVSNMSTIAFPSNLKRLALAFNNITELTANFPITLSNLCLAGNPITAFYANASQFELLSHLLNSNRTETSSAQSSNGTWNTSSFCDIVFTTKNTNSTCVNHIETKLLFDTFPICIIRNTTIMTSSGSDGPNPKAIWIALVVVCVLMMTALIGCLVYRRRYLDHAKANKHVWYCEDQPSSIMMLGENRGTVGYGLVKNDIRFQPSFKQCYIAPSTIVRDRVIARGGFGIVYLASIYTPKQYQAVRKVAMKRVLPQYADDLHRIEDFMLEIDLCARLCHPKIVAFVGITWTSLYNLSCLTEYMPNGDVWTLLERSRASANAAIPWNVQGFAKIPCEDKSTRESQPLPRMTLSDYTEVSTATDVDPECVVSKFSILHDLAEAISYLHCLHPLVVHRDVKTKNVLLDANWVAKLADFGTSRTYGDRNLVMTAEIGTVPWIAPEVLKGTKYSEKADIYSFGVTISEVDLCMVPYSNLEMCTPDTEVSLTMAKSHIALLVTSGQLRPSFSTICPPCIIEIARRCLAYYPEDRPSAAELLSWFNHLKHV
ncbi:kinase [Thraustotheca clavata]|uniref:Kinase n=1 Tax=Thraustotheca clavata TaxID=74557 RepID=A0A1W0A7P3_9STRA|nr:kinase [Thraustotheca clavata]